MIVILQQLGSQGLLNNLFMVEARVSNDDELHTNDDTIVIHNTQKCLEKRDAQQEAITQKRRQELWDVKTHWQLIDKAQVLIDGV